MLRFNRSLLAASISAALFVPQTYADDIQDDSVQEMPALDQCLINEPDSDDPNNDPIYVTADSLEAINEDKATYTGDVLVTQGKKTIIADSVVLHQQENIVIAEGNVNFSDGEVSAVSTRAVNNLNTDEMELENTSYQFLCEPGRGDAVYIAKTGKAVYEIEDGSITSCPENDNSWRLRASSIDVDQNEEEATFYNPRFEIQKVPVFYLPYLTVPIGDTRKTGFLYPSVSYGSSDGFEAEVPIYFNLAPNYDLTTTVHYMQERGTQLINEFRYLSDFGRGNLDIEYLHDDAKNQEEGSRWGYQYTHNGIFKQAWKFEVDYSEVSDINYFRDLSSSVGNREDGQLLQEGEVTYRSENWDLGLLVRDFQVLSNNEEALPYRVLPQVDFNYYAPAFWGNLDFDLVSHASIFDTDNPTKPTATRLHIEPGLTLPIATTWGSWTTEARVLGTHYNQDMSGMNTPDPNLDESVTRVIPEFRSHAGLVLERDTTIFGGYTQTLEPQVQYVYVPEEDQSNIALYDTTLLQTDYYGLFRSRKYSGVDLIADANQLSYGASSRFFDDQYKERLNISFGQIFYFDRDAKNPTSDIGDDDKTNYSSWAIETDFNYNDSVFYHGGIQYDIDSSSVQLANSTIEYRFTGGYVQTNYRYVSYDYIDYTVGQSGSPEDGLPIQNFTNDGISQLGLLGSYQISPKWSANAQYYYDLTEDVNLEWLAAVRYRDDCWYVGVTYTNQLDKWPTNDVGVGEPEYETNISLNFGIIGFGTAIGASSSDAGYDSGGNSLGYGRPFFLNN